MPYELTFLHRERYDNPSNEILLPVILALDNKKIKTLANLDTGASFCIFKREHGEALDLEIEAGIQQEVGMAAGGSFLTYGHVVTLTALGRERELTVYFAKHQGLRRNVLGRQGWIEVLRLGLIHYDRTVYASHYDEPPAHS